MGYASDGLNVLVPHVGQGPGLWHYVGIDAHASVVAGDFFADGDDKGMRVGDNVLVNDNTTPFGATLHQVTVVTAGGAATIGAALFT
jgi:hypothetical protein